jgi:hypothetical protein
MAHSELWQRWPRQQEQAPTGEAMMHPMFVKLFIETDADDLLAEEQDRRRRARRSKRSRPAMVVAAAPRDRDRPVRR